MNKEKDQLIVDVKKAIMPDIANLLENQTELLLRKFQALESRLVERLSFDVSKLEDRLKSNVSKLEERLSSDIRGTKVLIEQLDRKFDESFGLMADVSEHSIKINDHSKRIKNLEGTVTIIKKEISAKP